MTNKNEVPQLIKDFISAVNSHDGEAFIKTFADDALVNDFARSFWGKQAIKRWSDKEMIEAKVTFETDEITEHYGDYLVTALTDGNYDKSKAADPLYLDYFFTIKESRIVKMIVILNRKKSINYKS
jgi:ketosteroid isomerase-like protein